MASIFIAGESRLENVETSHTHPKIYRFARGSHSLRNQTCDDVLEHMYSK